MADSLPPPDVQAAAARVQTYLDSTFVAAVQSQGQQAPGPGPQKVSDDTYRAMTPAQRLDYARQFDQKQFQNNKDGRR